jgi:hypothetical protein
MHTIAISSCQQWDSIVGHQYLYVHGLPSLSGLYPTRQLPVSKSCLRCSHSNPSSPGSLLLYTYIKHEHPTARKKCDPTPLSFHTPPTRRLVLHPKLLNPHTASSPPTRQEDLQYVPLRKYTRSQSLTVMWVCIPMSHRPRLHEAMISFLVRTAGSMHKNKTRLPGKRN